MCEADRKLLDYSVQFIIERQHIVHHSSISVKSLPLIDSNEIPIFLIFVVVSLPEGTLSAETNKAKIVTERCVNELKWMLNWFFLFDQRHHLTIKWTMIQHFFTNGL